jgi:hypothetical protein
MFGIGDAVLANAHKAHARAVEALLETPSVELSSNDRVTGRGTAFTANG